MRVQRRDHVVPEREMTWNCKTRRSMALFFPAICCAATGFVLAVDSAKAASTTKELPYYLLQVSGVSAAVFGANTVTSILQPRSAFQKIKSSDVAFAALQTAMSVACFYMSVVADQRA